MTRSRGDGRPRRKRDAHQDAPIEATEPREEVAVLDELRALTNRPGFIHALAALTFKSNIITAVEEFTSEDFAGIYRPDRLIRTETNLLIGLMLSCEIDVTLPSPALTMAYVEQAIALLEELHQSIISQGHEVFVAALRAHDGGDKTANPLNSGVLLREAIFYGGESAFPFQYEALARERYATDAEWMQEKMGFDIEEAANVLSAIRQIEVDKFASHQNTLRSQAPTEWSWLPIFEFSVDQVVEKTSQTEEKVWAIIDAFTVVEGDDGLMIARVGDYNKAATHPIVKLRDGTLFSFLEYGAFSALYENPFYWIANDKKYLGKHSQTRGSFVEKFAEKILRSVFPSQFVHRNVLFKSESGAIVGEADAILLYGNRAFIVQAKSKRLTVSSWRGDDESIAKDFRGAVQEAYDQAVECVSFIANGNPTFVGDDQIDLQRFGPIREFYPICITSEHYPALSFQSSVSLKLTELPGLMLPIVTDVFTIDVMAEMLETPLYFTDYLVKRAKSVGVLQVSHELVALSWYIKKNLHVNENEFMAIADDFMIEVDLAMSVRRAGIAGRRTPEGQLTRFFGTPAGKIIDYVNSSDRPDVHRLGELILAMDGEAANTLNDGIARVVAMSRSDHRRHDFSIGLKGGGGITVHCNEWRSGEARSALTNHCEMRKYAEKADLWYGVSVDFDGDPAFMTGLEFPWRLDATLEAQVAPFRVRAARSRNTGGRKLGRNDRCPCGSGRKYKKCCLQ